MKWFVLILFLLGFLVSAFQTKPSQYDICVYGETPAGIVAAVQAARMGKQVVLLSTSGHIGGVMTSGLTATDMNRYSAVGGVAREVFQRIYAHYLRPEAWRNQDRAEFFESSKHRTYTGKNDSLRMQWVYESHVLENIFKEMLREAGVVVVYNQKLDLADGVEKKGTSIKTIEMVTGERYRAKVFIDASYEGDLMAKSGVSYVVGREPNSQYNETLNGVMATESTGNKITYESIPFDPYVKKGDPTSGLLPFIQPYERLKPDGSGDDKVQAYTYRLTLTNDPTNRVAVGKPAHYDSLWFEFMARRFAIKSDFDLSNIITITPMPNKKTDTNHLDFVGASHEWAEADYATREKIARMHKDYALGKLWFLANDERVPQSIRKQIGEWGLAKDEYADNGNFPYQLYVREARRMVSDFVMTEHHCKRDGKIPAPNPVGLGTYAFDSHVVDRVVSADGLVRNEGPFLKSLSPYPISYDAVVPKASECTNLLVPICLSASHVAYSTIRMEPVYMVLGQSVGTAASMAIDHRSSVQALSYEALKHQLQHDAQILTPDF